LQGGQIIALYDCTGRKVSGIPANDGTMQLNIYGKANGIYLVRILDKYGNVVWQKKVVKTQ
jgi:hypothetical protein